MGWWDEGIMGGDTPLDWRGDFEDKFGSLDEDFNKWRIKDGEEPIPFVVPTAEQTLEHLTTIEQRTTKFYDPEEDGAILRQVLGFLHIERGGTMSDELRAEVIKGIDSELSRGCKTWCSPEHRIKELQGFRVIIESYPAEGGAIEMPHQPGLFEKMSGHFT